MSILVTGSEGTIGRRLCYELEGDVYRLDLQHGPHDRYMRADVANYRELESAFKACNPSVVYHLAAEFGRLNGEAWYERLWNSNVVGTRNVLELCREYSAQLVFASSSEVYGETGGELLSENLVDDRPANLPNEYAISKWVNEKQIANFSERYIMPRPIVCRFFNAYGPGEEYHPYRSVVALFCYRALHNIAFDVYKGYHRVFMYLDDFISTLAKVHLLGEPGATYNIGGVDYRSVEELAEIVLEHTGASSDLVRLRERDEHNVVSKQPDLTRAKRDLEHYPTVKLEDGVRATVNWMEQRYG